MGHIVILGHSEHPPLGVVVPLLQSQGHTVEVMRTVLGEPLPASAAVDGLVILGAPVSIYQRAELPWLDGEMTWVAEIVAAKKPIFGICFGCQMLAKLLGGDVYPRPEKPDEWAFTKVEGLGTQDALFGAELDGAMVFQSHGDTYSLPEGALHLLEGAVYHQQAAKFADNMYGVQFHPELDDGVVTRWVRGRIMHGTHREGDPDLATALADMKAYMPRVHAWLERFLLELF